jgi:hypothetical protein
MLRGLCVGLRVYAVDSQWTPKSVLLGTREFDPTYNERRLGIRVPFKRWIFQIFRDFGLEKSDFFAATTDAGSDVKWMMRNKEEGLGLEWEWCIPHMIHAAGKRGEYGFIS